MRRIALLIVTILLISACGGGDGEPAPADEGTPATAAAGEGETTDEGSGEESSDSAPSSDAGALGGSATFDVDGTVITFTMDEVVYSPNEAIEDVTFEDCSANFFGVGMFRAIGYPVDANGELLLSDNGDIAGILDMIVPPDDWEAQGLSDGDVELTIESEPAGIDLRIANPDLAAEIAPDADHSWTISENGVTGSIVMVNVRSEPFIVEFEAVCE